KLERFKGQIIAFGILGSNAEDAYARILTAENLMRIDAAHDRVLGEMNRFAFNISARIQQHEMMIRRRNNRGDAASVHPGNPPQPERRGGKNPPGAAQ